MLQANDHSNTCWPWAVEECCWLLEGQACTISSPLDPKWGPSDYRFHRKSLLRCIVRTQTVIGFALGVSQFAVGGEVALLVQEWHLRGRRRSWWSTRSCGKTREKCENHREKKCARLATGWNKCQKIAFSVSDTVVITRSRFEDVLTGAADLLEGLSCWVPSVMGRSRGPILQQSV